MVGRHVSQLLVLGIDSQHEPSASAEMSQVRPPVRTRERYAQSASFPMGADFWGSVVQTLRTRVVQQVVGQRGRSGA